MELLFLKSGLYAEGAFSSNLRPKPKRLRSVLATVFAPALPLQRGKQGVPGGSRSTDAPRLCDGCGVAAPLPASVRRNTDLGLNLGLFQRSLPPKATTVHRNLLNITAVGCITRQSHHHLPTGANIVRCPALSHLLYLHRLPLCTILYYNIL